MGSSDWRVARGDDLVVPWLRRQYYRRLLVPLLRGQHSPEHTARGVMFGLAVAFTPLVGVQLPIVAVLWLAVRRFAPQWDFSLLAAMAWTWVTNAFTAPAIYYLFLVTGRLMLGHWERVGRFDSFEAHIERALAADAGLVERWSVYLVHVLERFGLPMVVGCVPWSLLMGWLGYRTTLPVVKAIRSRRARRRAARAADAP